MTRESVDLDAIELPPSIERKTFSGNEEYLPHDFETPEEVPAMADFGGDHIARYTTSTHDKAGYLTADPATTQMMIEHYAAKIDDAADDIALYRHDREDGATTLVVSYGVASRSVAVAVREARAGGAKVSSLTLQTLYPVPETALREAMAGMDKVVVPELNLGQYIREVERLAPADVAVRGVNKMDTTLISPREIIEQGGLQ
jgi:2-oxoglutarate ferredoxin oxidoreductase subunit alpha